MTRQSLASFLGASKENTKKRTWKPYTKSSKGRSVKLGPKIIQYANAFLLPFLPLLPEGEEDDDGVDDVAAMEQLYPMVQPLFPLISSSSMKICLYLHSTLQNALSPLHQNMYPILTHTYRKREPQERERGGSNERERESDCLLVHVDVFSR